MEPVTLAVILAAFVGGMVGLASHQARGSRRFWARIADQRNLVFDPGGFFDSMEINGVIDDVTVKAHMVTRGNGNTHQVYTVVEARPNVPLPEGLQLTKEGIGTKIVKVLGGQDIPIANRLLDGKLRVRGDDPPAVQGVLDHPLAEPALEAVATGDAYTRFEKGSLIIEKSGHALNKLEDMIDTAVRGARGLDQAVRAPWLQLAEERGFRHEETPRSATLDGMLGGQSILIRAQHTEERARTDITIHLDGGLPRGVRLRAGKGDRRLRDPILDGRMVMEATTRGTGPETEAISWLKDRLADEQHDLRGCLMDVLQGLPGAMIEDGVLSYSMDRRAGSDLPGLLDRLTALSTALSDPAPRPADPEPSMAARPAAPRRQRG